MTPPPGVAMPGRAARRVLIVDDSRTIRALLRATIATDPRLEVVGEAGDPYQAREAIKRLRPDVLTLDVEMPRMNGLVFLDHLMRLRPMPVVMVSTRTRERSADAVRALAAGAVDCVDVARLQADARQRARLIDVLVQAASASVSAPRAGTSDRPAPGSPPGAGRAAFAWNGRVVLIGSSTGGVDALERVLSPFPADGPPVIIAQHMPAAFLRSFAQRLDGLIAPAVALAAPGAEIRQGTVLIAPGGDGHIELARDAGTLLSRPASGQELHVPSIDRLFFSALPHAARVLAVILTGMGRDGAEALAALRAHGADTIVQSGETAVIDGMPRAAREAGGACSVLPLGAIGEAILGRTARGAGTR